MLTNEEVLKRLKEYFNTDFTINEGINSDSDKENLYVKVKNGRYKRVTAVSIDYFKNDIESAIEAFKPIFDFMNGEAL